jgi:hypothetical protein
MPEGLEGYFFEIADKIVSHDSTTLKFCQLFLQGVKPAARLNF